MFSPYGTFYLFIFSCTDRFTSRFRPYRSRECPPPPISIKFLPGGDAWTNPAPKPGTFYHKAMTFGPTYLKRQYPALTQTLFRESREALNLPPPSLRAALFISRLHLSLNEIFYHVVRIIILSNGIQLVQHHKFRIFSSNFMHLKLRSILLINCKLFEVSFNYKHTLI